MTIGDPTVRTDLIGEGPEGDVYAMYIAHVACDVERYRAAGVAIAHKPDPSFEGLAAARDELLSRMRARGEL